MAIAGWGQGDAFAVEMTALCRKYSAGMMGAEAMARVLLLQAGGVIGGNADTRETAGQWASGGIEVLGNGIEQGLQKRAALN